MDQELSSRAGLPWAQMGMAVCMTLPRQAHEISDLFSPTYVLSHSPTYSLGRAPLTGATRHAWQQGDLGRPCVNRVGQDTDAIYRKRGSASLQFGCLLPSNTM